MSKIDVESIVKIAMEEYLKHHKVWVEMKNRHQKEETEFWQGGK